MSAGGEFDLLSEEERNGATKAAARVAELVLSPLRVCRHVGTACQKGDLHEVSVLRLGSGTNNLNDLDEMAGVSEVAADLHERIRGNRVHARKRLLVEL